MPGFGAGNSVIFGDDADVLKLFDVTDMKARRGAVSPLRWRTPGRLLSRRTYAYYRGQRTEG